MNRATAVRCVAVQQEAPLSRASATEPDAGLDVGDVRYIKLGEKVNGQPKPSKRGRYPLATGRLTMKPVREVTGKQCEANCRRWDEAQQGPVKACGN